MKKPSKKIKLNVRINKKRRIEKTVNERTINEKEFIDGFEDKVEHYVENYVDKVERTKRFTLISGVAFFMLLIIFLYAFNFKSQIISLETNTSKDDGVSNQMEVVKNNINNLMDNFKEIKSSVSHDLNKTVTNPNSILEDRGQKVLPKSNEKTVPDSESIKILKEKLLDNNIK